MKRIILLLAGSFWTAFAYSQSDVINIIPSGNVGISSTAPVSSLEVSGSYGQKVTTITVNTTLDVTHNTIVCNNGGTAIAVTLPTASAATGRVYVIKRNATGTANVTITPTPTLDGQSSYVLTMPNQSIEVFSDGSEWKTTAGGSSSNSTAWSLTGNSGTTASTSPIGTAANNNFIGTTDAKDFVIVSNNLERMRIASGGNVGIGTSSIPNGRLAVVDNGLNTHAMQIIHTNATNSNGLNIQTQTNLAADFALRVVPNAGTIDAFIVRNTGNVGIGSSSPTALLNISSASASTPIHLNNTATGTTATDGGRIAVHDAGAFSFTNYENSAFLFQTSGVTERMRLTDAGNLGIGTASPQQMLHVGTGANRYFQAAFDGLLTARYDNNSTPAILTLENRSMTLVDHGLSVNFGLNKSGAAGVLSGQIRVSAEDTYNAAANQDSYMSFTTALDGSPGEKMRIKSDGNVGISTNAPAYTLQVGQNTAGNNANYSMAILRHGDLTTAGTYSVNTPALQIWDVANDGPASLESTGMVSIAVPRIGDADLNAANALVFSVSNDNGYGLVVKGNRNVGIGTLTPNQRLEVSGNARITALASGANGAIVRSNTSGDLSITNFSGSATEVLTGAGTFVTVGSLSGDDWTLSGSNLYTNSTAWNVGIGNSSPAYKLHVSSDISNSGAKGIVFQGSVAETNNNGRAIAVQRNNGTEVLGVNNEGVIIGNTTGGSNTFIIEPRAGQHTWFNSGGNMGIGTSAPTSQLHVKSDVSNGGVRGIVFQGSVAESNNNGRAIAVLRNNGTEVLGINNEGIITGYTTAGTNTLFFDPRANADSWFNSGGNVGVGTSVPGARFEVRRTGGGNGLRFANFADGGSLGAWVGTYGAEYRTVATSNNHGMLINHQEASDSRHTLDVSDVNGVFAAFVNGKVGIGTTTPASLLHVGPGSNRYMQVSSIGEIVSRVDNNSATIPLTLENRGITAVDHGVNVNFNLNAGSGAAILSVQVKAGAEDTYAAAANQDSYLALSTAANGSLTEKVRIKSDGNLGVGTTNPAAKLEVAGGARITNLASGASGAIVKTNTSGDLSVTNFSGTATDVLTGAGTFVGISTISGDDWTQSGSNLYPNNTGWNVGVGNSAPNSKLHITSDVSNTGTRGIAFQGSAAENGNNGRAISVLRNNGTEVLGVNNEGIITGYTTGGTNTVFIDPRVNQHLWFNTGGNLGVGNAAPGFRLDVTGNARIGNTGGVVISSLSASRVNLRPSVGNGDIVISDDSGTPARGITVVNGGNLGVGTDAPAQKLEVAGNARVTSLASGASGAIVKTNTSGDFSVTNFSGSGTDVLTGAGTFVGISTISGDDWTQSGSVLYPNTITWNVGVGTSAPAARFEVRKPDGGNAFRFANFADGGSLGSWVGTYGAEFRTVTSGATHGMLINHNEANDARHTLDISDANGVFATFTNGKMGMGTLSPPTRLSIASAEADFTTGLSFGRSATGAGKYVLTNSDNQIFRIAFASNAGTAHADYVNRMVINGNGNVGIGSVLPAAILDIVGANTGIGGTNQGGAVFVAQDGLGRAPIAAYGNIDGAAFTYNTASAVKLRQQSGTGWSLETSGTIGAGGSIYVNGNIGIGTTVPAARLEVAGQVKITGGTPGLNKVLTSDAAGLATWTDVTSLPGNVTGTGSNGHVSYWTGANTQGYDNTGNFFWDATNDRLGIGTITPLAQLQVNGAQSTGTVTAVAVGTRMVGHLDVQATDAYTTQKGGRVTFSGVYSSGGALSTYAAIQGKKFNATDNHSGGNLEFITGNNATGAETVNMVVDNVGNVGIGVTAPTARLHVINGSGTGLNAQATMTDVSQGQTNILVSSHNLSTNIGVYGFYNQGVGTVTAGSGATIYGTFNQQYLNVQNSATLGNSFGTFSRHATLGASPTGTISNMFDLYSDVLATQHSGTANLTISNHFGIFIGNKGAGGAGIIKQNAYGLYIADQTGATNSNYSIYSVGGRNYFGGNVGVGTTAPGRQIEVYGTTPGIKLNDPGANGNSFVELSTNDGGLSYFQNVGGRTRIYVGGERMTFLTNGNVGIGTSAPAATLDVLGTVNVMGARTNLSLNTIYQAPSDGFVCAYGKPDGTAGNAMLHVYADANPNPTTVQGFGYCSNSIVPAGGNTFYYPGSAQVTVPVKKGEYYKITFACVGGPDGCNPGTLVLGSALMYFLPLGHN